MTLTLDQIAKTVGDAAHIHPTSLTLEKGTLNVLLGPTLAGKTTLMRLMAGLDTPTAGSLLWDGEDVTGVQVRKRDVAMVYQQFINYPSLTVYENIASPLRVARVSRADIDRRVGEAAELLKLTPLLQRKPLELSGGQQQRTALARALVKNARLVLMDEPLANLDYKLREELRAELPRIFAEAGTIFVYATTEPSEALLLGGNTATLHEGQVTQFGPTLGIYRRPLTMTTAKVFSDPPMNFLGVTKTGGSMVLEGGQTMPGPAALSGLPDGPYHIGFRPSHLRLVPPGGAGLSFEAKVAVTEITGSESFIHVDYGSNRWVALVHGVQEPDIGSQIAVYVAGDRLFIFDGDGGLVSAPGMAAAA